LSPPLHGAILRGKEDVGGGLVRLTLEPPSAIRHSYVRPGQYVVVRGEGKDAYFVLAGDVGQPTWELVLRPSGDAALATLGTSAGGSVEISEARGEGFPMEEAQGRPLLVAVTGSGIAAGRPVVRARLKGGEARDTELLFGVRRLSDVPMEDELQDWVRGGVRVTLCLSREHVPPGRTGVAAGYVQDVARAHAREGGHCPRMIFAAGVREMIDAVRALATELGAEERDFRTNY
jgi:NAD(P)H-flavin reductase